MSAQAEATLDRESDVRLSLRLSSQAKQALDDLQRLGGYQSIQETIRHTIGDQLFLKRHQKEGWTVLLKKGNQYRELVWSNPG